MWSSYQIDEMKSSLFSVSSPVFSFLKDEWEYWLAEGEMMENLMISTWEISQLVKMKDFRGNIGRKEEKLANKTITLTGKTVW